MSQFTCCLTAPSDLHKFGAFVTKVYHFNCIWFVLDQKYRQNFSLTAEGKRVRKQRRPLLLFNTVHLNNNNFLSEQQHFA